MREDVRRKPWPHTVVDFDLGQKLIALLVARARMPRVSGRLTPRLHGRACCRKNCQMASFASSSWPTASNFI